ncbi:MAG: nucleoside-diphosphate kinase [Planctomycetota bacterium]|jgi:nucleoside-diphosphate kinase
MQRTLVFVKPDGVQRRLVGQVISRFETKGLKIRGMKLMQVSRELAETHYAEHKGRPFYEGLVSFVTSGPIVAICLEGFKAISVCRKMIGATFGFDADAGTIRGDYGISNQYNLIHGSDSEESAAREIELYFGEGELIEYSIPDEVWMAAE